MDTQTVYGIKAALALLDQRRDALIRLYHAPALRSQLSEVLSWAAARHIPYRELDPDQLRKLARSEHHEGLVVVSRPLRYQALTGALARRAAAAREMWMGLDGVSNPFNLGAIVRSCAFFGVAGLLAGGPAPGDKVNGAVLRVAEGGAEHLPLFAGPHLTKPLGLLREAGFRVIGVETDGARDLIDTAAEKAGQGPLLLVLGQEREGLSQAAREACHEVCRLRGGGPMPSLNVSVAAGVALAGVTGIR